MWLNSEDSNTTFFYCRYKSRLSRNHISEITSADGNVSKGFVQVKEAVDIYFRHIYREDGIGNENLTSDFLSPVPSQVSEENNVNLMKPFTEEEISNVVWDMESDKAPGPD